MSTAGSCADAVDVEDVVELFCIVDVGLGAEDASAMHGLPIGTPPFFMACSAKGL